MPIITLTTDFGLSDAYVGAMKGVILSIAPHAVLVDVCHNVPPQTVATAAFLLYQAVPYFPPDAIHLIVVDPGVGGPRRLVAVKTPVCTFVAPDNGVLSMALAGTRTFDAVELAAPDTDKGASATFHGRDFLAPAAARLACGTPLATLGPPVTDLLLAPPPSPEILPTGEVLAHVIHVDAFGNLILDATDSLTGADCVLWARGRQIPGLRRTFSDVAPGQLVAYAGSTRGHLEIAVREGNAARMLGMGLGDVVRIRKGLG